MKIKLISILIFVITCLSCASVWFQFSELAFIRIRLSGGGEAEEREQAEKKVEDKEQETAATAEAKPVVNTTSVCETESCIFQQGVLLARTYPFRPRETWLVKQAGFYRRAPLLKERGRTVRQRSRSLLEEKEEDDENVEKRPNEQVMRKHVTKFGGGATPDYSLEDRVRIRMQQLGPGTIRSGGPGGRRGSLNPFTKGVFDPMSPQAWQGLLLVKNPKAASSTMAGVLLRLGTTHKCLVQYHHVPGHLMAERRAYNRSFLVGSVRHPATRALSSFFFFNGDKLSENDPGNDPTDAKNHNLLYHLKYGWKASDGQGKGGAQFNYMASKKVPKNFVFDYKLSNDTIQKTVPEIQDAVNITVMTKYDFIVVTERMDESLTALAMIMEVPLRDVLIASNSKVSGGFTLDRLGFKAGKRNPKSRGKCVPLLSSSIKDQSSEVKAFLLNSTYWLFMNYADYLLYAAANASLDRTIDEILGRDRFEEKLNEFKELQQFVQEYCGVRLGSGCSPDGVEIEPVEPCYDRDFGCGYQCVDEALARKMKKKNSFLL